MFLIIKSIIRDYREYLFNIQIYVVQRLKPLIRQHTSAVKMAFSMFTRPDVAFQWFNICRSSRGRFELDDVYSGIYVELLQCIDL